jgi:CheY-like chemotaxis protein
MDGYEAARRLRELLGRRVMLIALTGWGQDDDKRRSREAGFDHHLTKPPEPELLDRLIEECAEARR